MYAIYENIYANIFYRDIAIYFIRASYMVTSKFVTETFAFHICRFTQRFYASARRVRIISIFASPPAASLPFSLNYLWPHKPAKMRRLIYPMTRVYLLAEALSSVIVSRPLERALPYFSCTRWCSRGVDYHRAFTACGLADFRASYLRMHFQWLLARCCRFDWIMDYAYGRDTGMISLRYSCFRALTPKSRPCRLHGHYIQYTIYYLHFRSSLTSSGIYFRHWRLSCFLSRVDCHRTTKRQLSLLTPMNFIDAGDICIHTRVAVYALVAAFVAPPTLPRFTYYF